jgi:dienelactone hydrolase
MRTSAVFAVVLAAGLLPQPAPAPTPTGPLGVRRAEYHVTGAAPGRELQVHLWYPYPLPPRPSPVILFSHGAGTPATQYTAKLDDLASHGYMVVAPEFPPDPPGAQARCRAPDGTPYDEMVEIGMRCLRERAQTVADDIRVVLDWIAELNATRGRSPDVGGAFDPARIAAVGHSLGGFASVRACQQDPRIVACVNEDGGTADGVFLRYAGASSPRQPILYVEASVPAPTDQQLAAGGITRADWNTRLDRMVSVVHEQQLRSSGRGSYKVELHAPGMQHGSFGDLYLSANTAEARRTAMHNLALSEAVTRAFLDKYLKRAAATLLDDPAARSEIVVKKY